VYAEFSALLKRNCTIQRVLDVDLQKPNIETLLDTQQKLRQYLVNAVFVQEDLLVSCPTKAV
jgi:hypothetical protein